MNPTQQSLYEWVDARVRSDAVVEHTKYAAATVIIHHLSVLRGMQISRSEVEDFLRRVLDDVDRMLAACSELATAGENLDAMNRAARQPSLAVVEGGKNPVSS